MEFIMKKEVKNIFKKKSKKAEIEEPEEIESSDENVDDELEQDSKQVPAEEKAPVVISPEKKEPETKPVPEKSELTKKQKISALKRALENKTFALEKEKTKVRDWRSEAEDRDGKATAEFQKRKTELEELLKKSEARFNKRIAKTNKWWRVYSDNYESTKIKKIEDDITLLQSELTKLEATEPEPAKAE
jgi:hypothetical protein